MIQPTLNVDSTILIDIKLVISFHFLEMKKKGSSLQLTAGKMNKNDFSLLYRLLVRTRQPRQHLKIHLIHPDYANLHLRLRRTYE